MIKSSRPKVFAYMMGIIRNKKCHPYIINGIEDHVHILTDIHPTVSLASLVKDIKMASHKFIDHQGLFPRFKNWQDGYGAFTYAQSARPNLIRYIENQESHHHGIPFEDECISLLEEHGVEYDERYLFD